MNRELKIISGIVAFLFALMVSMNYRNSVDHYPASRLILTNDGCAYAQSIGLSTEQDKGQCVLTVRYRPYVFSDGGVIYMPDDRKITITNNMMLAYQRTDADLPLTSSQKSDARWFWIWLGIAGAIALATIIYRFVSRGRTKGKTK